MSKSAQIIFNISPDGEVTNEVINGDGKSCTALTKPYEEAIGGEAIADESRQFKPEHGRKARLTPSPLATGTTTQQQTIS